MADPEELRTAVIVEDDPDLRHLIAAVFESAGFSVVSVGNGIDGVRAVVAYQPLITTLDVSMPGIDGFEAARRIRAAGSPTFIIMVTAMGEEADIVQGLGSGADDYIIKPFRPREFRARIDAFLRRPRRTDEPTPVVPRQERVGPSFPRAATPTTGIPIQAPSPRDAPAWAPSIRQSPPGPPAQGQRPEYPPQNRAEAEPAWPQARPTAEPVWHQPEEPADTMHVVAHDDSDHEVIEGEIDEPSTAVERRDPHIGWLRHRDLYLDPASFQVEIGDRPLELTETEFALLHTLMESRRRIRSRADLTLVLRGESYVTSYYVGEADKRAIGSHMDSLRRKLGEMGSPVPRYLEAVRDAGYRMTPETDM